MNEQLTKLELWVYSLDLAGSSYWYNLYYVWNLHINSIIKEKPDSDHRNSC